MKRFFRQRKPKPRGALLSWMLEGSTETSKSTAELSHPTHPWWQVMCLTGVDYFSTLGYQPGIAFLAAGYLSPIATLILVALTLLGALPIYRKVAEESPHGQGSISMIEALLPRWRGKLFVLVLLGFAATDFVITITLSAADATAHIIENPYVPHQVDHPVLVTSGLLLILGAIFLKGFKEAIGLAVVLVGLYLGVNAIVLVRGLLEIAWHPEVVGAWKLNLMAGESRGEPTMVVLLALIVFPKLALGLSGFETGVAVMPLVAGDIDDPIGGRVRNTRKLLTTAALIMSAFLIGSSLVTTMLVPAEAFRPATASSPAGPANGRALAYLAHGYFGDAFGTVYDIATIAILWFAGASALAGLLNLVPRYLPRYGMAPEWARVNRPLVLIFTVITLVVTWLFNANVEAQGGAYATGVLVLMLSASIASTLAVWNTSWRKLGFLLITLVFAYTTIVNIIERPDGVKIACVFIAIIVATSFLSRVVRSTELRITGVELDELAMSFLRDAAKGPVRIVTNRPDRGTVAEYTRKVKEARDSHHIPANEELIILEVQPGDASEFTDRLEVSGYKVGPYRILRCESPAVPNAIAALLIYFRDELGTIPHVYFGWTEGNPIVYVLKFIVFGEGDTAPVTREVLRQAIDDPRQRPRVHVG
jgi:hypothetical protein